VGRQMVATAVPWVGLSCPHCFIGTERHLREPRTVVTREGGP
jgi:hypothetical protein